MKLATFLPAGAAEPLAGEVDGDDVFALADDASVIDVLSGHRAAQRSDRSWHGHLPFEGPRRSIQFNWVTDRFTAFKENARHFLGSKLKAAQESLGARG